MKINLEKEFHLDFYFYAVMCSFSSLKNVTRDVTED